MMIRCFGTDCKNVVEQAEQNVSSSSSASSSSSFATASSSCCEKCVLSRFCSQQCRLTHSKDECHGTETNPVLQIAASFANRVQKDGLKSVTRIVLNLREPNAEQEALIGSCWSTAFALVRVVSGFDGVETLVAHRSNMETMLLSQEWNAEDNEEIRNGCMQRCAMIAQVPNPVPLVGWILPGENFMRNSPSRHVERSYDHAFAVVPLNTRDEQGKVLPTNRAVLIQSFGGQGSSFPAAAAEASTANTSDASPSIPPSTASLALLENTLLVSVIDKRVFWTAVRAFVAARVWTDSVAKCYERAFGVCKSFPNRAMQPCFDAVPLMPPKCAKCKRVTPPSTCTRCHRVVYCSPKCQQEDWSEHRAECEKSVQSAQHNVKK